MAEQGCSPGYEVFAEDTVNYFTETHDGDYEGFDIAFQEGPTSPRGHKTCEITVTGLGISGTNGGDLNNATILVEALPGELNLQDKRISSDAFFAQRTMETNGDISPLAGVSDLVDDAMQYANTNDMTESSQIILKSPTVVMELSNPAETSALSIHIPLKSYQDDSDMETLDNTADAGGFAVVTTDDEQRTDTERSAAEALAYVFSIGLARSGFDSKADFEIYSKPRP